MVRIGSFVIALGVLLAALPAQAEPPPAMLTLIGTWSCTTKAGSLVVKAVAVAGGALVVDNPYVTTAGTLVGLRTTYRQDAGRISSLGAVYDAKTNSYVQLEALTGSAAGARIVLTGVQTVDGRVGFVRETLEPNGSSLRQIFERAQDASGPWTVNSD